MFSHFDNGSKLKKIVNSKQRYVVKFVSDLQQSGAVL